MTTKIILLILFFIFSSTSASAIDTSLPAPTILPDNPMYFFKSTSNKIRTLFTTKPEEKAKLYQQLSEEKLSEANAILNKGNNELAQKLLIEYQQLSAHATNFAIKNKKVNDDELLSQLAEQTVKHEAILNQTKSKFPQFATENLDNAISNNRSDQIKTIENLSPDKINLLKQKISAEKQNLITKTKSAENTKETQTNTTKQLTLEQINRERNALETFEKSLNKIQPQITVSKPASTLTTSDIDEISKELSALEKELDESFDQLETEGLVQGASTNNILENILQFLHLK